MKRLKPLLGQLIEGGQRQLLAVDQTLTRAGPGCLGLQPAWADSLRQSALSRARRGFRHLREVRVEGPSRIKHAARFHFEFHEGYALCKDDQLTGNRAPEPTTVTHEHRESAVSGK